MGEALFDLLSLFFAACTPLTKGGQLLAVATLHVSSVPRHCVRLPGGGGGFSLRVPAREGPCQDKFVCARKVTSV